jgi:hypothetical protein
MFESVDIEINILYVPVPYSYGNNLLVRNYSQNETEAACVEDPLSASRLEFLLVGHTVELEFLGHRVELPIQREYLESFGYPTVVPVQEPVQDKRMDRPNLSRSCLLLVRNHIN